jgi:hypothetical protein
MDMDNPITKQVAKDRERFKQFRNKSPYARVRLPSAKQISLAKKLSAERNLIVPSPCLTDSQAMTYWIALQLAKPPKV